MRKNAFILSLLLFFFVITANAARVDRISIPSRANNMEVKTIVLVPDAALGKDAVRCPVVYLLHGFSGNENDWINSKKNLPEIVDEKGIIIVCPDGKNSWYLNSPIDAQNQYETFISSELIDYIDKNYSTITDRYSRAITGLSMGGHGALYNAFKHPDVFGAVGAMSGAIDILGDGDNFGLINKLPSMQGSAPYWGDHSVIAQAMKNVKNKELAISFECGISDFCFFYNEQLHKVLVEKKIDHDYTVRPGEHT